jgi:hypothetical protein
MRVGPYDQRKRIDRNAEWQDQGTGKQIIKCIMEEYDEVDDIFNATKIVYVFIWEIYLI